MAHQLPPVVAVFGPTGSGKTDVAVHLARLLGTEVVNADPAQCYAGFPTLTNKPGAAEDAIAPHRLVGCWPLTREASVADYEREAHAVIDALVDERGHAVVCGGSGLYQLAALCQLQWAGDEGASRPADDELRARLHERYEREGGEALHAELAAADPHAAARIHPNDRKRVVRAIEAAAAGGSVAAGSIWDAPCRHDTLVVGLSVARDALRARIDSRTRDMFANGVLEEVAAVVGARAEHLEERLGTTARQIHGLQDTTAALRGDISEQEAIERLATRTRQYAKRQDTWARRWPGLWSLDVDQAADPAGLATLVIREGGVHAIRQVAGPR